MNSATLSAALLFALAMIPTPAVAFPRGDGSFVAPDAIVLKDGRTVKGLIVKNSVLAVTLQESDAERTYPKSEISRILDNADTGLELTKMHRRGHLPSWRTIVNDLRTHDSIRSLVQIPAVRVDTGSFRNVPYRSFRLNRDIEFNLYGNPEDPAGMELGIFGMRAGDDKLRRKLRAYFAGFLTGRDEIRALYEVDLEGGSAKAGDFIVEITPKDAPDAFGAWWISLYKQSEIDAARLSDAAYAKVTLPADQVIDHRGHVKDAFHTDAIRGLSEYAIESGDSAVRGFYRDATGLLRTLMRPKVGSESVE